MLINFFIPFSIYILDRVVTGTPVGPSLQSLNDLKKGEILLKEGRLLGLKAFGIATAMCLSGAVLVVGTTRWALDVETVRILFPKLGRFRVVAHYTCL